MKLTINHDNGRLTQARLLRGVFKSARIDRDADALSWLEYLSAETEPFVLFLHSEAVEALDRLAVINAEKVWPERLKGVVIFNSNEFAGLAGREHAKAEIEERNLSAAPIHIMRSAIHDDRPEEVIERVAEFVSAVRAGRPFGTSVWLLDPSEELDALLSLWILDRLVNSDTVTSSGLRLGAHVLGSIDHDALRALAAKLGVAFETATARSLRELIDAIIGRHSEWPAELLCRLCSVRGQLRHELQSEWAWAAGPDPVLALVQDLYEKAGCDNEERAEAVAAALPLHDPSTVRMHVKSELDHICAHGCHFAGPEGSRRVAWISAALDDYASDPDPARERVVQALQCEVRQRLTDTYLSRRNG
jgi:hypothetical protein